mmetsp:Transcript_94698/g.267340  ORF Transcript_94698/g.267340 Transcript_94698/m.267340 type:complete len:259 (+) Transcript_94698:1077-1853(+)
MQVMSKRNAASEVGWITYASKVDSGPWVKRQARLRGMNLASSSALGGVRYVSTSTVMSRSRASESQGSWSSVSSILLMSFSSFHSEKTEKLVPDAVGGAFTTGATPSNWTETLRSNRSFGRSSSKVPCFLRILGVRPRLIAGSFGRAVRWGFSCKVTSLSDPGTPLSATASRAAPKSPEGAASNASANFKPRSAADDRELWRSSACSSLGSSRSSGLSSLGSSWSNGCASPGNSWFSGCSSVDIWRINEGSPLESSCF